MSSIQNENYTINKIKPCKSTTNRILILLLVGGFMSMLNETALNIAFPHIMGQFNISAGTVQWLTTVYVYVSGIVFLISAFLIERFSTRKLFTASMGFLIAGTIVACFSTNFPILFVGRVIQAIGTGILVPLIFNTVLILIPPEKRGATMGMVTLVVMFAPTIAPVLMGFLMGYMDWHWFFVMVLVFFVAIAIAGIAFLKNVTEVGHPKLDLLSVILAAIGFGGVVISLSGMGENGLSPNVSIPLIVGMVSLILFAIRQLTMKEPMLDLRTFKYPSFTIGIVITMVNVMVIFAMVVILPIYLQSALGVTSFIASLILLPGSILNSILSLVSGRIYDGHGPKIVISSGLAIMCISMVMLSFLSVSTLLMVIVLILVCFFIGTSLVMAPNQTHTLGTLPPKYYASGSAIMTALQQMGGAIGSALFVSFMSFGQNSYLQNLTNPTAAQQVQALVSGVDFAYLIAAVVLGVVFILSLFLKRENPA
ncbi:MDR family MFS transporter [Methanobacterium formicicum]|uniref:EmrB/QacA subfamily drug resistance transporter n=1 Tax=Methanobacterium formicicum (strain DSM 3637 / PP1) TaxID=1204725 RepID=K2R1F9_METFP|nr:MDR family MFS transporter [Methanobacterium formicicum]EKF85077.1 EmrB/QacA subfamily drug resistance transporter [Methanobacterium formicicum DSM 3637]